MRVFLFVQQVGGGIIQLDSLKGIKYSLRAPKKPQRQHLSHPLYISFSSVLKEINVHVREARSLMKASISILRTFSPARLLFSISGGAFQNYIYKFTRVRRRLNYPVEERRCETFISQFAPLKNEIPDILFCENIIKKRQVFSDRADGAVLNMLELREN